MKRFLSCVPLSVAYAGQLAAQTCTETIAGTITEATTTSANTCGSNLSIKNVCGAFEVNGQGVSIYQVPVGSGHGAIHFAVSSAVFTPTIILQEPGGCAGATCDYIDEASFSGATASVDLPDTAAAGTYLLTIADFESETPGCGGFNLSVSGGFGRSTQIVSFSSTVPSGATAGGDYVVTAQATSGLPVALSIDPASTSSCQISGASSGSTVSFTHTGSCIVDADQAGDSSYMAAERVQQSFDIAPNVPDSLRFVVQPNDVVAGAFLNPAVKIALVDAYGNTETTDSSTSISLRLASGTDSSFSYGGPQRLTNGTAVFGAIRLTNAGDYRLGASSSLVGIADVNSDGFNVAPGLESELHFSPDPPPNTSVGVAIPDMVTVVETDAYGNTISDDSANTLLITAIGPGPLRDSPVMGQFHNGVATFDSDLILDAAGTYKLQAQSDTDDFLPVTDSQSFTVGAGSGLNLQFTSAPSHILEGASLGAVVVTEMDSTGNRVASDNSTVVALQVDLCGTTTISTGPVTAGQVTFHPPQHFHTPMTSVSLSASTSAPAMAAPARTVFDVTSNTDFLYYGAFDSCAL